jgi:hypothetical protein
MKTVTPNDRHVLKCQLQSYPNLIFKVLLYFYHGFVYVWGKNLMHGNLMSRKFFFHLWLC